MALPKCRSITPSDFGAPAFMRRYAVGLVAFAWLLGNLPAAGQDHVELSKDPQKRITQLPALVGALPGSQGDVRAVLADDDLHVRYEALKELTKQQELPQSVLSAVTQLASSPDAETRILAIGCLGRSPISEQAEVDAITTALGDPVATVRLAAIQATPTIEPSAKCLINNLLTSLEDPDTSVQLGALKILKDIKCDQSAAVPILAKLSEKAPSAQVRASALEALGNLTANTDSTADLLLRLALRAKDADVRRNAVRALQSVQSLKPEQVSSLAPLIHDSSSRVRQSAAITFVLLGRSDPHAAEMVAALQDDPDEGVRDFVAFALRYGNAETAFFLLLAKSLRDKSLDVKLDAVESLLKLAGDPDKSPEEDEAPDSTLNFLAPDGQWPRDLVDASLQALSDPDSATLRESIAIAARRFEVSDESLVKRLAELGTADPDPWVRQACVRAIGNVATTQLTLAALIASTHDAYSIVRKQAVTSLGKLSRYEWPLSESRKAASSLVDIENALAERFADPHSEVKVAALNALDALHSSSDEQIPQEATSKAAIMGALKDEDPDIREAAAKTLGPLSTSETEIDALVAALRDENVRVGVQAAKSLAAIGFSNRRVQQSVGLTEIIGMEFVTLRSVIATTTQELRGAKPRCHVIDVLIASVGEFQSSELQVQEFQSLAEIASNANAMITALQEGEMPSNPDFIKAATVAIDDCAPSVERAGSFLAQHLNDPDPHILAAAAEGVGNLELQSPDMALALDRLSRNNNRAVRNSAVAAIPGVVSPDDVDGARSAAEKLVTAASDTDSEVRVAAIESLTRLKSVGGLTQAFHNPDPDVRKAVLEGYITLGTPASEIEAVLKAGLKDSDRQVRLETLSYLSSNGIAAAELLNDVLPLLKDNNAAIRAAAASFLGFYKSDAAFAVPALNTLLTDEDFTVRSAAADSLGWIGSQSQDSIAGLASLLADDTVGTHARVALQQIGIPAIAQLSQIAQSSSNKQQAQAAADVLKTISASEAPQVLRLKLAGGNEVGINLRSAVVIAVATWCPFSQRLREFLLRDDVRPYFKGITLYFLLENETDTVIAHIQKELTEKDWTEEHKKDVLAQVRRQVTSSGYFDQSFLSTLPGERYQVSTLSKLAVPGLPSILAVSATPPSAENLTKASWWSVYDWARSDWFSGHVNMPEAMLSELKSISGASVVGF